MDMRRARVLAGLFLPLLVASLSLGMPQSAVARPVGCAGWSVVPSPTVGDQGRLFALDAVSANDIWAVGESQLRPSVRGLTEHWDGTGWSIVPSVYTGNGNELTGVAAVATDDVWAVGFTFAQSTYKDRKSVV